MFRRRRTEQAAFCSLLGILFLTFVNGILHQTHTVQQPCLEQLHTVATPSSPTSPAPSLSSKDASTPRRIVIRLPRSKQSLFRFISMDKRSESGESLSVSAALHSGTSSNESPQHQLESKIGGGVLEVAKKIGTKSIVAYEEEENIENFEEERYTEKRDLRPKASSSFVSRAVRDISPAVVLINTEHPSAAAAPLPFVPLPLPGGGEFAIPFPFPSDGSGIVTPMPSDGSPAPPASSPRVGQGSGFIFDDSGLVLTNAHVVKEASSLTATLHDGRVHRGEVLGTDRFSDLAVVRLHPEPIFTPYKRSDNNAKGPRRYELKNSRLASQGNQAQERLKPERNSRRNVAKGFLSRLQMPIFGKRNDAGDVSQAKENRRGSGGSQYTSRKPQQDEKAASSLSGCFPVAKLGDSDTLATGDWVIAIGSPFGLENTVTLGICSSPGRSVVKMDAGIDMKGTLIQTDAAINPGNSGGPLCNEFGEVVGINAMMRRKANSIGFAVPINRAKAIIDDLTHGRNVAYSFLGIEHRSLTPDLAKELNEDGTREEIFGGEEGENAEKSDEGGRSGSGGAKSNSKENSFLPEIFGSLVMKVQPGSAAAAAGLKRGDVICGFRVLDGVRTGDGTVGSVEDLAVAVDATPVGGRIALQVQRGRDRPPFEVVARPKDLAQVEVSSSSPTNQDY